ncbi:hypothetical protein O7606_07010 [Micromonospora sp. WMMD882]|uniref:hypothetical protein n=1 Tax=Micromonospora sp. WMMD882 TaxID=3015151 RepID=UPI00248AAC8D|nr:hypothetical protein [Micromonospora sp. WMMD882]WBB81122.1 hypothetical protein O7606_07010 [Micromonospora sp. WMMD882]
MNTYGDRTSDDRHEGLDPHQRMMDAIAAVTATLTGPGFESGEEIRKLQSAIRDNASRLAPTDREPWERVISFLEQIQKQLDDQSANIRTLEAQNEAADRRARRTFAWGVLLGLPVGMIGTLLMWAIGIS